MPRAALTLSLLLLGLAGCGPADPLDRKIDAESPTALAIWHRNQARAFSPLELQRFDRAQKELQWFVVTEWQGLDPQAQQAKWRDHVHRVTVRQFIIQGHQFANLRLERERADQRRLLLLHDQLLLRPSTGVDDYQRLRHTMLRIGQQIDDLTAEIAANDAVIAALGGATPATVPRAKRHD